MKISATILAAILISQSSNAAVSVEDIQGTFALTSSNLPGVVNKLTIKGECLSFLECKGRFEIKDSSIVSDLYCAHGLTLKATFDLSGANIKNETFQGIVTISGAIFESYSMAFERISDEPASTEQLMSPDNCVNDNNPGVSVEEALRRIENNKEEKKRRNDVLLAQERQREEQRRDAKEEKHQRLGAEALLRLIQQGQIDRDALLRLFQQDQLEEDALALLAALHRANNLSPNYNYLYN